VSGGGRSFGYADLQAGADWEVQCSIRPGVPPVLAVSGGTMRVAISVTSQLAAEAVGFGQELARQSALFAAECARLHAAQQTKEQARDEGQADLTMITG